MKTRFLAILLAILPSVAWAGQASVLIQGKAVVSAGSDVILDASGSSVDPGQGIYWSFEENSKLAYGFATPANGPPNSWCGIRNVQAGDYAITAITFTGGPDGKQTPIAKTHRLIVTPGGLPPNPPGPRPPDPPPPPPVPKPTGILHATMIYAEQDASPAVLAAKSTQLIRDELLKAQTYWHVFDVDQQIVKNTFINVKFTPPCLIITTADGKLISNQPLPDTPSKIVDLIWSFR